MARLNSFQRATETIPNSILPFCFRNNQEEEVDQASDYWPVLWIRIVFRIIVDLDPYSHYRSGSTHVKIEAKSVSTEKLQKERKRVGGNASSIKLNLTVPCRTVLCQYHGWGMPGRWAGTPFAVYVRVQCQEPKPGLQFYCEDDLLFLSSYYLSLLSLLKYRCNGIFLVFPHIHYVYLAQKSDILYTTVIQPQHHFQHTH